MSQPTSEKRVQERQRHTEVIGIGHADTAAATYSNSDSHSHSYDASAALNSDDRREKHRMSDARRYQVRKFLLHELDALVHDKGDSSKKKRCGTSKVLREASERITDGWIY